jgi:AhpD family alkylhydroperoxidase
MPRIPEVAASAAGPVGRLMYRIATRKLGALPQPLTVMRNHPGVLRASLVHEAVVDKSLKVLPETLRDLVVYRVATVLGCSWCVDFGAMKMRLGGLDIERLGQIDEYATSEAFDETERLCLAYADAMTATPSRVTDEQVAELARRLGNDGVVELTYVIALENLRGRANTALGIVDQGFSASCAVPPQGQARVQEPVAG